MYMYVCTVYMYGITQSYLPPNTSEHSPP